MRYFWAVVTGVVTVSIVFGYQNARADDFSSSNYKINGTLGNSFGEGTTSANYKLESSGGESVIGNGASGSYKMGLGYIAQLERSLSLTTAVSTVDFGTIVPGVSGTQNNTVTVATDYASYNLSVHQDMNLTKGSDTIPAVSGTIASPAIWTEGTTKGLGFTLASASASGTLDPKWSIGAAYAALPTNPTDTVFYSRGSIGAFTTDTVGFRYRLDVSNTQPSGLYTNNVTITCTATL